LASSARMMPFGTHETVRDLIARVNFDDGRLSSG
jgi:hypothetical protein